MDRPLPPVLKPARDFSQYNFLGHFLAGLEFVGFVIKNTQNNWNAPGMGSTPEVKGQRQRGHKL